MKAENVTCGKVARLRQHEAKTREESWTDWSKAAFFLNVPLKSKRSHLEKFLYRKEIFLSLFFMCKVEPGGKCVLWSVISLLSEVSSEPAGGSVAHQQDCSPPNLMLHQLSFPLTFWFPEVLQTSGTGDGAEQPLCIYLVCVDATEFQTLCLI